MYNSSWAPHGLISFTMYKNVGYAEVFGKSCESIIFHKMVAVVTLVGMPGKKMIRRKNIR